MQICGLGVGRQKFAYHDLGKWKSLHARDIKYIHTQQMDLDTDSPA